MRPLSTAESDEAVSEPRLKGFSGNELLRLRELRAWLAQRKLQREDGTLSRPQTPYPGLSAYPERQLLTPLGQRYALGFRKHKPSRTRTLQIERGAEGRVYHRIVFAGRGGASAGTTSGRNADSEPVLDTGTSTRGRRALRLWGSPPTDP